MATMATAARRMHCPTAINAARRKRARLRARSPAASARAMKVMIVLSRAKRPALLKRSVVAQATEKVPSAAGPSRRATRNVKMPRKFDASIATMLISAPRFNSEPCSVDAPLAVWSRTVGGEMVSTVIMGKAARPNESSLDDHADDCRQSRRPAFHGSSRTPRRFPDCGSRAARLSALPEQFS